MFLKYLAGFVIAIVMLILLKILIKRGRSKNILPLVMVLFLVMPGLMAFAPMQETEPDPVLWAVITQFLTMGGFAALVAIVINICKAIGWIKDGTSGTVSAIANLVGLVGVFVLQNYVPNVSITLIDEHMTIIAQIMTSIFTYVYQYWISKSTHDALSAGNVPIIGTSLTPKGQFFEVQLGETKAE